MGQGTATISIRHVTAGLGIGATITVRGAGAAANTTLDSTNVTNGSATIATTWLTDSDTKLSFSIQSARV